MLLVCIDFGVFDTRSTSFLLDCELLLNIDLDGVELDGCSVAGRKALDRAAVPGDGIPLLSSDFRFVADTARLEHSDTQFHPWFFEIFTHYPLCNRSELLFPGRGYKFNFINEIT